MIFKRHLIQWEVSRMDALIDKIQVMNERLVNLKQQIDLQNNIENIKRNEQKYQTNVTFLTGYVKIVEYITKEAGFVPCQTLKDKLFDALETAKNCVISNKLNEKYVELLSTKRNECEVILKHEWKKFYDEKSIASANLIQYLTNIYSDETRECKRKIDAAKVFKAELSMFVDFVDALKELDQRIEGLKLDEKTKRFLLKITNGEACVNDIDTDILAWIQTSGLSRKIKLSFR